MRSHFIEGLKSDVQLQLIAQDPIEDLGELYHTAINIDGWLYKMKRQLEETSDQPKKKKWFNFPVHAFQKPLSSPSSSVMEVDASTLGPNGKLNPSERAHQKKLNLCLYCGQSGHQATTCPSKKGKANAVTTSTSAKFPLGKVIPWAWVPFSLWNQLGHHIDQQSKLWHMFHFQMVHGRFLSLAWFIHFWFTMTHCPSPLIPLSP